MTDAYGDFNGAASSELSGGPAPRCPGSDAAGPARREPAEPAAGSTAECRRGHRSDDGVRARRPAGACANAIRGTGKGELLRGTDGGDRIDGGGGADDLRGGAGDDCLSGGGGRDLLRCGPGDDVAPGDQPRPRPRLRARLPELALRAPRASF